MAAHLPLRPLLRIKHSTASAMGHKVQGQLTCPAASDIIKQHGVGCGAQSGRQLACPCSPLCINVPRSLCWQDST